MDENKIGFLMFDLEGGAYPSIWGISKEDAAACRHYLEAQISGPGSAGKQVVIICVDEATYLRSGKSKTGEPPPLFKTFRSAQAASDFLGYFQTNPVGQKLGDARRALKKKFEVDSPGNKFAVRAEIVFHGLTFQYEEDVKD